MVENIFRNFLRERGHKVTKEREAILKKVFSLQGHFDPESLYLNIRKSGLKASRASVYRTLNLLNDCGLIERVRTSEHGSIYEQTYGHKHHDHMHCMLCGRVIEFYSEDLERIQEELCKQKHFEGTTHTLEIRGYCKKCQKKRKKP